MSFLYSLHSLVVFQVVFCALLAGTVLADHGDPTIFDFFRVLLGWQEEQSTTISTTSTTDQYAGNLQVIAAGLPRTGTASFVVAMQRLGLKTYHMKEGMIDTPGHVDLWYNLYTASSDEERADSLNQLFTDMTSRHGFTASSDAPTCFWFKQQMERYPNAKVVLTVRGDGDHGNNGGGGEAWKTSFSTAIIDAIRVLEEIPFCWVPKFQKITTVVQTMLHALETDIDPETGYPVVDQLPTAYDQWVRQVKETVPPDRLLIHAARDGWEPLCNFISPLSSDIASNCNNILASKEAYPHVNDKAKVQALIGALWFISRAFTWSPLLLLALALLRVALQRQEDKAAKSKPE